MTVTAPADVVATITNVAHVVDVPPELAIAVAQHESGLNPTAVGDNGTSYGLYQLHQGGELGDLTPQQAFDPLTNARVALTTIARVFHANPNLSPGEIAAKAQRPADPVAYAAAINGILGVNGATSGATPDNGTGTATGTTTSWVDTVTNLGQLPFNPFAWPKAFADLFGNTVTGKIVGPAVQVVLKGLTGIVFTVAALGLIALGLSRLSSADGRQHFENASQIVNALGTAKAAAALA